MNRYSKAEAWKGPHVNVRLRIQEQADKLDSALLNNGSELLPEPELPYRVWAG